MTDTKDPAFKRILLKLSGEALMGKFDYGIDPEMIAGLARDIVAISNTGVEVAIVIGGGNIFRGAGLAEAGMQRVSADHMGMLATVINSLSLQDAIQQAGKDCRVMSAVSMHDVCEDYTRRSAVRNLENSIICIFAAGTGNPFFTTDSAAALRASEIEADLMIKATKVDGVYDADPVKQPDATRYDELTFDEAIVNKLAVMDATAMVLCRDNNIPLRVFNMFNQGDLAKVVAGESIGTLVQRG